MQLIGQAIRHETFGKGVVTGRSDNILTVCFSSGNKKFIYPDAFVSHLTLKNDALQSRVLQLLDRQAAEKKARLQAQQQEQEQLHRLQHMRLSPVSQAAFNIAAADEAELFSHWTVSTGRYRSGELRGEPRIPDRMKPNSLCLLTMREPGTAEADRLILGAFMVPEDFWGMACRDGSVSAHPVHRISLTEQERPAFWPYLTADPKKQCWGATRMKYFPTTAAQRILLDLLRLPEGAERDKRLAFYEYFCQLNRLTPRMPAAAL